MSNNLRAWFVGGCVASLVALPAILLSAERASDNAGNAASVKATDMFELMATKEIDVTLIPKDEFQSRVIIRNNTNQPLNVKLPEAFAGMPILAQRGGGAGGIAGGGRGGGAAGGQQQSVGGGMGGMGGGMGGMGGGMGMMNVPPEKVAQFKVPTVCLEHGKKTPNAHMAYRIRPIDAFSTKPELKALLATFGKEKLDQRATQAAAWHVSNDLTWEQLAGKRIEHIDGSSEPWFSPQEIQAGMEISQVAFAKAEEAKAKDKTKKKPQGDSQSESSNRESNERATEAELEKSAK